uniref:Secreted protein n=1 Tax=Streptomyces sp. NBC_00008 TaxID=2903610 RepID=A0AAU2VX21_9ACTN
MTRGTERHGGRTGRGAPYRLLALALTTALGLVVGGVGAGSADAASVCAGRPAKTLKFGTGELRVYRTRSYACALAVAVKPGARRKMSVQIQPRGGRPVVDKGSFTQQAGPVTVHALNRCVRVSGTISGKTGTTGWILC